MSRDFLIGVIVGELIAFILVIIINWVRYKRRPWFTYPPKSRQRSKLLKTKLNYIADQRRKGQCTIENCKKEGFPYCKEHSRP